MGDARADPRAAPRDVRLAANKPKLVDLAGLRRDDREMGRGIALTRRRGLSVTWRGGSAHLGRIDALALTQSLRITPAPASSPTSKPTPSKRRFHRRGCATPTYLGSSGARFTRDAERSGRSRRTRVASRASDLSLTRPDARS